MAILESRTRTGISWISESIALFKQAPRKWLLLALVFLGLFVLLPSVPGLEIFGLITMFIWPAFVAIAIRQYRNVEFKKTESLSTTIQLIQPNIRALVILGFVNLLYLILVSLLSTDAKEFAVLMNSHTKMNEAELALAAKKAIPSFLMFVLLLIPMFMMNWFSPMLIAFNNYSLAKAIKSSIAGCLQYIVALIAAWLLLSTGMMALIIVASLIAGLFAAMQPSMAQSLVAALVFGCVLISIALTFAFQYVSYRDVFRGANSI
ncbi:MAG: BPSS1780 family membrane protein [Methylophilaceae bacterium]